MRKIDTKCFWGYRPIKKEDKDFEKNKSTDISPTNMPSGEATIFYLLKPDQ